MFTNLSDTFKLSNGVEIPCVGYGTFRTPDGEICAEGVRLAIESGYRHIDTAAFYQNESGVGEGVRRSGIQRKDIFVTTKVWNDMQGYDNALRSFDASAKKLGFDTIDLLLVHWPAPYVYRAVFPKMLIDTWRAFEKLYKDKQVRAIGVCNSHKHHLKAIFGDCEIKPMVNQIEYHVGLIEKEAEEFSKQNGITVEAWAPLCKGRMMDNAVVSRIAKKHGCTPAQVLVRWCLQRQILPLPKSVTPSRIKENAQVFGFELDESDMEFLNAVKGVRYGAHPDTAEF
jgi:diketogulonate reductase-like aldo/keto reductase